MTPEIRTVVLKEQVVEKESQHGVFLWFVDGIISDAIGYEEMMHRIADSPSIYSALRDAKNLAREQLRISSRNRFRSLGTESNYQDSQVYRKLGQMCNDDPERRASAIIDTVTYVMPKVLETIPRLAPVATPEDLFVIANASSSFIDNLGASEGTSFNSAMKSLSGQDMQEPGFNEEVSWRTDGILVIGRNGLDFSDRVKQRFSFGNNSLNGNNRQGVLWGGGDNSSIKRLHSWFVNQVTPSYEQSRR